MYKKIILLLISLFLLSCTSPLGQVGLKFKDRNGIYKDTSGNITVTVTEDSKQNFIIDVQNFSGVTLNDTYDIVPSITTGNFNIKSKSDNNYTYIISFYGNTSVSFSVRKGTTYVIDDKELKNTK